MRRGSIGGIGREGVKEGKRERRGDWGEGGMRVSVGSI